MNTILIYTSPALGHLYPLMDIAKELKEQDYRVIIQTLSSEKDRVINEGIEHRNISHKIEEFVLEDYKGKNPISQLKTTFNTWLNRAEYEVEDLKRTNYELKPDLLIVDANTWGAGAFAESQKKPWAMFMPYCLPVPSPWTPAYGPGLPPPSNWFDRLRDRIIRSGFRLVFKGIINKLDKFRSKLGVQPLSGWENLFSKPDLLLYLTAEPFEYPREVWPSNVQAIGPGLWAPPSVVPNWIDDLPRPRVLVSVSTELQEDGKIIDTALEALSNFNGSAIVTTAALDPQKYKAPNDRMRITKFLPHASIIPKVDLVITHGGMGTTQRALAEGIPVCVIPWGRDQNETARRIEVCRAGVMISKKKLNPKLLKNAIHKALNRASEAQIVAASFKKAGGAKRAVELISKMLVVQGINSENEKIIELFNPKEKLVT